MAGTDKAVNVEVATTAVGVSDEDDSKSARKLDLLSHNSAA